MAPTRRSAGKLPAHQSQSNESESNFSSHKILQQSRQAGDRLISDGQKPTSALRSRSSLKTRTRPILESATLKSKLHNQSLTPNTTVHLRERQTSNAERRVLERHYGVGLALASGLGSLRASTCSGLRAGSWTESRGRRRTGIENGSCRRNETRSFRGFDDSVGILDRVFSEKTGQGPEIDRDSGHPDFGRSGSVNPLR